MTDINVDFALRNEGIYYGDGTASLSRMVAKAVAGKKSAKGQAGAAYAAICKFADAAGYNPKTECFIRQEGKNYWRVSFEAGPYSWAVPASDALAQVGILAEPYYSFDLCFYGESI